MTKRWFGLLAAVAVVGCGGQQSGTDIRNGGGGLGLTSDRSGSAKQTPEEEKAVDALNTFSLKLARVAFGEGKSNVIVSPVGVMQGLQLLEEASDGATQAEIRKALKSLKPERLTGLTLASSLWSSEGIEKPLKETRAAVAALKVEGALQDWFEKASVPEARAPSDTAGLVMLSAGRIPTTLAAPFDSSLTKPLTFKGELNGEVPFLHGAGEYRTFTNGSVTVVELPLAQDGLALRVVLPSAEKGTKGFLKELDEKSWAVWSRSLVGQPVDVALPKLRLNLDLELDPLLAKVGVTKAFVAGASFGKLSDKPMHVSEARQALLLELADGVPAAQATAAAPGSSLKPVQLVADRPFALFLVDRTSSAILAAAFVARPEWQQSEKSQKAPTSKP